MNTTSAQAQRYVLISVIGLLVIAAYRGKLDTAQLPFAKRLWGTGVLAIILGLVADVAPQIAGPFSILILVGSVTNGGDKALHNFLGKASGSSSPSSGAGGKPRQTTPQAPKLPQRTTTPGG